MSGDNEAVVHAGWSLLLCITADGWSKGLSGALFPIKWYVFRQRFKIDGPPKDFIEPFNLKVCLGVVYRRSIGGTAFVVE